MSRFYIDCEFNGHGGELLSMALIRDDGDGLYLCVPSEPPGLDPWVAEHVWPLVHAPLPIQGVVTRPEYWAVIVRVFIGREDNPTIIADSPVDIGRFCSVHSTNEKGGWLSTCYQRMSFEVHNVDCYPTTVPDAVQHNAYWDAMALRQKLAPTGGQ